MSNIGISVLPRGAGKTTRILEWMRAAPEGEHRVCVSATQQEAMRLLRENRDLESWQFVGPDDVTAKAWSGVLAGRGGQVVLGLDNADLILRRLMRWPIGTATWTAPDPLDNP
jgi:hypothetical protein